MTTKRYTARLIDRGGPGAIVGQANAAEDAGDIARVHAWDCEYGTCVHDTTADLYDCGNGWEPEEKCWI